jgi:hypothetical protein
MAGTPYQPIKSKKIKNKSMLSTSKVIKIRVEATCQNLPGGLKNNKTQDKFKNLE